MIIGICGKAGTGKDTIADVLVKDYGFVKVAFADVLKRVCKDIFQFSDEQLWGPSDKRNEPDPRYLRRKAGAHGWRDVRMLTDFAKPVPPGTFDKYPDLKGYEHLVGYREVEPHGSYGDYGYLPTPPIDEYLTPRHALQQLGTEWGRSCYGPIWVEYAMRIANELLSPVPTRYTPQRGLEHTFDEEYVRPAGVVISDVRFQNEVEQLKLRGAHVLKVIRPKQGALTGAAGMHISETEQDAISEHLFDGLIVNDGALEDLVVMTQGYIAKFQFEKRDEDFTSMLVGIGGALSIRPPPVQSIMTVEEVVPVSMSMDVVDSSEEFEFPLSRGTLTPEGLVLPGDETPAQAGLRGMLEARQRDVDAGKILPFDAAQAHIPPFKRNKP